jgi:hypothetical protein
VPGLAETGHPFVKPRKENWTQISRISRILFAAKKHKNEKIFLTRINTGLTLLLLGQRSFGQGGVLDKSFS